jgi:hypothetical protein
MISLAFNVKCNHYTSCYSTFTLLLMVPRAGKEIKWAPRGFNLSGPRTIHVSSFATLGANKRRSALVVAPPTHAARRRPGSAPAGAVAPDHRSPPRTRSSGATAPGTTTPRQCCPLLLLRGARAPERRHGGPALPIVYTPLPALGAATAPCQLRARLSRWRRPPQPPARLAEAGPPRPRGAGASPPRAGKQI